jgi:hypothetical protein
MPSDPGTLFPSIDGDSPGTEPARADVTGQVLPDLAESSIAAGQSNSISHVDMLGGGQVEGAEPGKQLVAGGEIDPPAQRKGGRTAADRIAQLTKKYRQEQDGRSQLEVQLSQLVSRLEDQSKLITQLSSRSPAAHGKPDNSAGDPSGLGDLGGDAPKNAPASDIAAVVQQALVNYDQQRQYAEAQKVAQTNMHIASFKEACEEFPELADARTSANRLFLQLYNTSPLRALPDAPYQIALQVRGILADEASNPRVNPAEVDARKRGASIVPSRSLSTPTPEVAGTQRVQLEKELGKINDQMKAGSQDPRLYIQWRKLRSALQQNK